MCVYQGLYTTSPHWHSSPFPHPSLRLKHSPSVLKVVTDCADRHRFAYPNSGCLLFYKTNDYQLVGIAHLLMHTQTHKHGNDVGQGLTYSPYGTALLQIRTESQQKPQSVNLKTSDQTINVSMMKWSSWLYSVMSVVVSVGAIFIITIIHLGIRLLQVPICYTFFQSSLVCSIPDSFCT